MSETFAQRIARIKEAREAAERARLSAALPPPGSMSIFPTVPTTPPETVDVPKDYPSELPRVGSFFMSEVNSVIARFQRANKPNQAFIFFKGFCMEAYKNAGMGEEFSQSKVYWFSGELKKWQTYMTGIPVLMKQKIDEDPANTYHWIKSSMEIFEDKVINSIKTKFKDKSFPSRFFTDLLRSYQLVNGKLLMVGVGRKRRKTRKVRKTKTRQSKLRIKKRLTMS